MSAAGVFVIAFGVLSLAAAVVAVVRVSLAWGAICLVAYFGMAIASWAAGEPAIALAEIGVGLFWTLQLASAA